jgi:hypothetical protein
VSASTSDTGEPGAAIRVFINYRREETGYPAGWLYDRLGQRFGVARVFKDVDSIALGDDFVEAINRAVESCDVLIALIDDRWLAVTDESGQRRLDDPHDYVRLEIEAALARNVRIIPVLVDGARMPRAEDVPDTLAPLVRRQALELSPSRFDSDAERLIRVLESTRVAARASDLGPDEMAEPSADRARDATAPAPDPAASGPPAPSEPPTTAEATGGRAGRTRLVAAVVVGVVAVIALVVAIAAVGSQSDGGDDTDQGDGVVLTGQPATSPEGLELTDYRVESQRNPAVVNDRVTVSYTLMNGTETPVELDEIFVGVRNAADDILDQSIVEGEVLDPGERFEASREVVVDSAGVWRFWPCYALAGGQCPPEWQVIELPVVVE